MIKIQWLIFLMVFGLCSCGNDDQKKYSKLDGLRVLAIQADSPEINSPQSVSLTPYVSHPNGGDTTLSIEYTACLDPGLALGATPNCDDSPSEFVLTGTSTFSMATLGPGSAYTGPVTSLSLAVPPSLFVFLGTQSSVIQFNGLDIVIFFQVTDQSTGQTIEALKRVRLTTKTSGLNTNPTIAGNFQSGDGTLNAFPTEDTELSLSGASAPETYQLLTVEGELKSLAENMTISWFSNAGDFNLTRTDSDGNTKFNPEEDTTGSFVAVYRDNRGGVTFVQRDFP